jgi:hypothetical protein
VGGAMTRYVWTPVVRCQVDDEGWWTASTSWAAVRGGVVGGVSALGPTAAEALEALDRLRADLGAEWADDVAPAHLVLDALPDDWPRVARWARRHAFEVVWNDGEEGAAGWPG